MYDDYEYYDPYEAEYYADFQDDYIPDEADRAEDVMWSLLTRIFSIGERYVPFANAIEIDLTDIPF